MRIVGIAAVAAAGLMLCAQAAPLQVSKPGEYKGYAAASYDGTQRTSVYVPMRDGTKIAVDIFRPTQGGVAASDKLPLIWMHSPYNRRTYQGRPAVESYPGYAINLAKYGYNVAVADFRGVYASFGKNTGYNRGEWSEPGKWDAYDLTEWFAKQPYTNGKIGMWGCSATGGSQMQAATTLPPSLKAIIPMSAEFEAYNAFVLGGAAGPARVGTPGATGNAVSRRDQGAVAVDGPDGAALLAQAVASHAGNQDSPGFVPNRDSKAENGAAWWSLTSPSTYLSKLKTSKFGVMAVANWDEAGTRHGAFWTFNNLPKNNTKLLVGPATHCAWSQVKTDTGFDFLTEELRFFDYWLKGVKNNVMEEPAVTYFTYNAPQEHAWRTSPTWPLANEVRTKLVLGDGTLSTGPYSATSARYAVKMGPAPQAMSTTVSAPTGGLSFVTEPLPRDMEVTGHPIVNLWVSSEAKDLDVTAWLHDVAPDGKMRTYQMVGRLRASHRKIGKAPYNNLGLPWHSFTTADAAPVPGGQAVELKFDMLPMSYIFFAGHRIRLNLTFSDPKGGPGGAEVRVHQSPTERSYIDLPVIPTRR